MFDLPASPQLQFQKVLPPGRFLRSPRSPTLGTPRPIEEVPATSRTNLTSVIQNSLDNFVKSSKFQGEQEIYEPALKLMDMIETPAPESSTLLEVSQDIEKSLLKVK